MAIKPELPPALVPVLDIIAEMLADSMIKDLEAQNAERDGKEEAQQAEAPK